MANDQTQGSPSCTGKSATIFLGMFIDFFFQFESKLSEYHSRSSGSMLEVEFAEAADSLVSLVSDQLCRHLFLQSLVQLQDGENSQQTRKTLPIKRLSCIHSNVTTFIYKPVLIYTRAVIIRQT